MRASARPPAKGHSRVATQADSGQQTADSSKDQRVIAPFGRRRTEIVANEITGGYRLLSALDVGGPLPKPGQFYMLAAENRWGGGGERPFLPRAFSVAEATMGAGGARL